LLELTTNPLLTVGCHKVTGTAVAWLTTFIFAGLPRWPTTSFGNEIDLGLASRVAKTGLGEPVGVAVGVAVMVAVGVGVAVGVAVPVAGGVGLPLGNNPNTASWVCVPI